MKLLLQILRISAIIGLIMLAIMGMTFKFGDCDQFERNYNGTEVNAKEFMEIYSKQCFPVRSRFENNSFDISKLIIEKP